MLQKTTILLKDTLEIISYFWWIIIPIFFNYVFGIGPALAFFFLSLIFWGAMSGGENKDKTFTFIATTTWIIIFILAIQFFGYIDNLPEMPAGMLSGF